MDSLYQQSVEIILKNQSPSGAYIASPNFPNYHYSWFRDGSYIAYAMDLAGNVESASRYHDWAAQIVNQRVDVVDRAVEKAQQGKALTNRDILYTRYTLDGTESIEDGWGNFQLDGFGTWLWALGQHHRITHQPLPISWLEAARQIARYLEMLWQVPCYDCWEEFPDKIHTYTLAAICGGLEAFGELDPTWNPSTAEKIRQTLIERALSIGYFSKHIDMNEVDASLLGLSIPYNVVPPKHPLMQATVRKIEAELHMFGGVHRYARDTYYGGGEWILLTAWLGWFYTETGQNEKAFRCMEWIQAQADPEGQLPEQVAHHLIAPDFYQKWINRWGEIACPLLWSHAFYIVFWHKIYDNHSKVFKG